MSLAYTATTRSRNCWGLKGSFHFGRAYVLQVQSEVLWSIGSFSRPLAVRVHGMHASNRVAFVGIRLTTMSQQADLGDIVYVLAHWKQFYLRSAQYDQRTLTKSDCDVITHTRSRNCCSFVCIQSREVRLHEHSGNGFQYLPASCATPLWNLLTNRRWLSYRLLAHWLNFPLLRA